eukprot:TRINITY_DN10243_c0_g1_i1.p1 TRINITY_DN10243_c0_g1~~TRINITY_DN10243_c0_g1_i1.p1  ORF type:complete len:278 (+),score=38.13 TRINITY_DN10243_c0_g1_i1:103-936(+)
MCIRDRLVLSGAGISTKSGIPDYRSPNGSYSKGHKPMLHNEFLSSHRNRQRYWARSMAGWGMMTDARPNSAHFALAEMEQNGVVGHCVTQNVDRLHSQAGQRAVTELHGTVHEVVCLQCRVRFDRNQMQSMLLEDNPEWALDAQTPAATRADGDVEPGNVNYADFRVPGCRSCSGGVLKPNVVFFGANVESGVVASVNQQVDDASGLLVVGTSLFVWSGFRFVKRAHDAGKPVIVVNQGPTRADDLPNVLKIDDECTKFLPELAKLTKPPLQGWAME